MSESVSGVDAIVAGLRGSARRVPTPVQPTVGGGAWLRGHVEDVVPLADAEAAVLATVREIETWLREDGHWRLRDVADALARRFGGTE